MRIWTKVLLAAGAVIAIFTSIGAYLVHSAFDDYMVHETRKRQLSVTRSLATTVANSIVSDDRLDIRNSLDDLLETEPDVVYAFVTGLDGLPLAHTFTGGFPPGLDRANRLKAGSASNVRLLDAGAQLVQDFAYRPFKDVPAEVHVGFDTRAQDSLLTSSRRNAIMIGLAFFLVTTGLVYALDSRITRPLERMSAAVSETHAGRLGGPLEVTSNDEVGRLSEAFNDMQRRLHEQFSEIEAARKASRNLAQKVLSAQEQERSRVAAEVHDSLLQHMVALNYHIEGLDLESPQVDDGTAEQLKRFARLLKSTISAGRELVESLRPPLLEVMGLGAAVRDLLTGSCDRAGVKCEFHSDKLPTMDPALEIAAYRVVQEAVNNALRHAEPRLVQVGLRLDDGSLTATVCDDGRGFDLEDRARAAASSSHLGLESMRERAETLGGNLTVATSREHGTVVTVAFPLFPAPRGVAESEAAKATHRKGEALRG